VEKPHSLTPSGQEVRILLAEDNAVNQRLALRFLEKAGYRADAVASGREAVKALEVYPYDLVLLDIQMPEMDGYEVARVIRDPGSKVFNRAVPIVAMTANAMKGDRKRCIEAGMDDYVSKPVRADKLKEVLRRFLPSSPSAPEVEKPA